MVHLRLLCHQEEDSAFQVLASLSGTENKENVHHVPKDVRSKLSRMIIKHFLLKKKKSQQILMHSLMSK